MYKKEKLKTYLDMKLVRYRDWCGQSGKGRNPNYLPGFWRDCQEDEEWRFNRNNEFYL